MAGKAQLLARGAGSSVEDFNESNKFCRGRKMTPTEPEALAISYRRTCNRDVDDVCDHHYTVEQRRNARGSEEYLFAVRMNDTLDAIEKDQMLLSLNLTSCGYIIEQLFCSLGRVLQWEPIMRCPMFKAQEQLGYEARLCHSFCAALIGCA